MQLCISSRLLRRKSLAGNIAKKLRLRVEAASRWKLTNGVAEHCKPPQSCDGLCQVLLGIIELLDVSTDFLDHHLALLRLATYVIDLAE